MNALDLQFADDSFDAVFSSSSVEHFGDWGAVRRAMAEIHRVLKTGGIASISTEFRIAGDGAGLPGVLMFDEREIRDILLGDLAWDLLEPFDPSVSAPTLATAQFFSHALADHSRKVTELGGLWTHHMEYDRYPHIVLCEGQYTWTSLHIAMRKR
jgi:SAM-dependent methyltransferase